VLYTEVDINEAARRLNITIWRMYQLLRTNRVARAYKKDNKWWIPVDEVGLPMVSDRQRGPAGRWKSLK
jgi:hypothetical protein